LALEAPARAWNEKSSLRAYEQELNAKTRRPTRDRPSAGVNCRLARFPIEADNPSNMSRSATRPAA
jgi:hypothetical protein